MKCELILPICSNCCQVLFRQVARSACEADSESKSPRHYNPNVHAIAHSRAWHSRHYRGRPPHGPYPVEIKGGEETESEVSTLNLRIHQLEEDLKGSEERLATATAKLTEASQPKLYAEESDKKHQEITRKLVMMEADKNRMEVAAGECERIRKSLEITTKIENNRVAELQVQLTQTNTNADEAYRKYEEVAHNLTLVATYLKRVEAATGECKIARKALENKVIMDADCIKELEAQRIQSKVYVEEANRKVDEIARKLAMVGSNLEQVEVANGECEKTRKMLENQTNSEAGRINDLEVQLTQTKTSAQEANKKFEEVANKLVMVEAEFKQLEVAAGECEITRKMLENKTISEACRVTELEAQLSQTKNNAEIQAVEAARECERTRKVLETKANLEAGRAADLEAQLSLTKFNAEEANKKCEVVTQNLTIAEADLKQVGATANECEGMRKELENKITLENSRILELEAQLSQASLTSKETDQKQEEVTNKLALVESELIQAVESTKTGQSKIVKLQEELEIVGNNLKSLQDSGEKAAQREAAFVEQVKSLTVSLKEAETRAEFAERSVQKLQKDVDRLQADLVTEKEKKKRLQEKMADTLQDVQNM